MDMQVSREIAASPATVWAIITDIERAPETLSGVDEVERLDDGTGFGLGTRWRETRTMLGKQASEEMEVTGLDEGRSYTTTALHGATTYTSVLSVEPRGADRSALTMRFGADTSNAVGKVLAATVGRVFSGATRKMMARDLDDIAARAERSEAG